MASQASVSLPRRAAADRSVCRIRVGSGEWRVESGLRTRGTRTPSLTFFRAVPRVQGDPRCTRAGWYTMGHLPRRGEWRAETRRTPLPTLTLTLTPHSPLTLA